MKKTTVLLSITCLLSILLVLVSSCTGVTQWEYDSENGLFATKSGDLVLDFKTLTGEITINGEKHIVSLGLSNNLREVDLCEKAVVDSSGGVSDDDILVLFEVTANKKEKTLTLKAVSGTMKDNIVQEYTLIFNEGQSYTVTTEK